MDAELPPPTPNPVIPPPQVVIVVGWVVTACAVVSTATRCATKVSMKRILGVDDYVIIVATLVAIGQMVATFLQAELAKTSTPTGDDWAQFQKAFYAAELLFIPAISLAKISVLYSLHAITPIREHKAPIIVFGVLVSLIYVVFQFAAGFQCTGERWAILSGQCFEQTPFWQAWGALDITTDAFIVIFPIYLVSTLQMGLKFKCVVAGVFVARIAAIAAACARMVYLSRSHGTVQFDSFAFWAYILNTEVEQGLSIITACIPFLKPFFESLETGMMAPGHGLATMMGGSGSGSNARTKKELTNGSYRMRTNPDLHGINVSRRISTHSEECGLIKQESSSWIQQVPGSQV